MQHGATSQAGQIRLIDAIEAENGKLETRVQQLEDKAAKMPTFDELRKELAEIVEMVATTAALGDQTLVEAGELVHVYQNHIYDELDTLKRSARVDPVHLCDEIRADCPTKETVREIIVDMIEVSPSVIQGDDGDSSARKKGG